MTKNLVIVESPAKAKTIEGFLGKEFTVKSSYGHVRDLSKKTISIDVEKDFLPNYIISPDKTKIVKELKTLSEQAEWIWLATDEDREGEAISWHLMEALKLDPGKVKRIVFHEITKNAILESIQNPRSIDLNLVDAQQARRILDRLVGYELSPLLWKKVKPGLSAGRVQSVAVRIIAEREEAIKNFVSTFKYVVTALFFIKEKEQTYSLKAELSEKFDVKELATKFLEKCIGATFKVKDIQVKPGKKSPAPPFTTSTLQQEAARKLGFSVAKTMMVAQQLYESGKITYMRTDSFNLSDLALSMAKKEIETLYGSNYVKIRKYATKTKGAQEAHEAIRPTYFNSQTIEGDASQRKLYELIWKRTIASQMSDAILEKTDVTINISTTPELLYSTGEVIKFDGFLKVYLESSDDIEDEEKKDMIPPISVGQILDLSLMNAVQKFTNPPYRYAEASLVKKLEELGIGRPSTYAPTISTVQKREYVVKSDIAGDLREFTILTLKDGKIKEEIKTELSGQSKGKLMPTDLGNIVNQFLLQYFDNIIDYNFTASVEKDFDSIAQGEKIWNEMLKKFYGPFHQQVMDTQKTSAKFSGEKLLGVDPKTGKNIYVKIGRFGLIAQIGESDTEEKPQFAGLRDGQTLDTITLKEALKLFDFPRNIGEYEDSEIVVAIGRFGPYIKHKNSFCSIPKTDDPATIIKDRAIELILAKRKTDIEKVIKEFDEMPGLKILNGRFGPYISFEKKNYKIPKKQDPVTLNLDEALKIVETSKPPTRKKK